MQNTNRKLKTVTIILLVSLFLNVIAIWGYQRLNTNQARLEIGVENGYQRSFLELSDDVEQIKLQLAHVLVSASKEQTILGLANLWRSVYGAINSLNSLPLVLEELEQTSAFLRDAAEYSYYLIRDKLLDEQQMAAQEWNKLEEFYERVKVVQEELSQIQAQILNESLRFSDLANLEDDEESAILSAFRNIESQIDTFPVIELEEGVRKIEPEPREIEGDLISEQAAIALAEDFYQNFFGEIAESKLEFTSTANKTPIYVISLINSEDREPVYIEVSQHGGHILQMYRYRFFAGSTLSVEEAEKIAEEFLSKMGFKNLALIDNIADNDSVDLTFVPVEKGVYIYSDMIKLMVALDNGEIMSFDQTSYITRHYQRNIEAPKLSKEEILSKMNPNLKVQSIRLALITDEYSVGEYLTYEVRGEVVGETFAVFVDANSGMERRIVRLSEDTQYQFNTSD